MKNISVYIFAILFFFCSDLNGQHQLPLSSTNVPNVTSPEVAALFKYTDIPVSYYSGQPNIEIPLYNVSVDEVNIPIKLNYSSSGIKVEEEASWVGLGWNISMGGCITRKVNYLPDDKSMGWLASNNMYKVDFDVCDAQQTFYCVDNVLGFKSQTIKITDYVTGAGPTDITLCCLNNGQRESYSSFINGDYNFFLDEEPDEFYFNLPGLNGKFTFDKNGNLIQEENTNTQILYTYDPNTYEIIDWEVIDKNGTTYQLTKKQYAYGNRSNDFQNEYVSAWFLTKIITSKKHEIQFNYYPTTKVLGISLFSSEYEALFGSYGGTHNEMKSYTDGVYLKEIISNKETVSFDASKKVGNDWQRRDIEGAFRLNNISIKDFSGITKKGYNFSYNYFISPVASANSFLNEPVSFYNDELKLLYPSKYLDTALIRLRYRLKLESIREVSETGILNNPYTFTYNSLLLPAKTSYAVDFWGYFNGQYSNTSKIPTFSNIIYSLQEQGGNYVDNLYKFYLNADRNPNDNSLACILQKIDYPTGGSTSFTFEKNVFVGRKKIVPYQNKTSGFSSVTFNDTEIGSEKGFNYPNSYIVGGTTISVSASMYNSSYTPPDGRFKVQIFSGASGVLKEYSLTFIHTSSPPYNQAIYTDPVTINFTSNQPITVKVIDNDGAATKANFNLNVYFSYFAAAINSDDWSGAGLRIAKITNYDPISNQSIFKEYSYTGGVLLSTPYFFKVVPSLYFGMRDERSVLYLSSSSNAPLSSSDAGSYVGYSTVIEKVTSSEGANTKEFNYFNQPNSQLSEQFFYYKPIVAKLENGTLLNEKYYNVYNSKVYEKAYNYDFIKSNTNYGVKEHHYKSGDWITEFDVYNFIYYRIPTIWKKLNGTVETIDGVTKTTDFTYDPTYHQLSSLQVTNSDGNNNINYYYYPYDRTGNPYNLMVGDNCISPIVEYSEYNNSDKISGGKNDFILNTANGSYLIASTWKWLKSSNAYAPNSDDSYIYNTDNSLATYTHLGNQTSFLWGYNNTLPIAKVLNASNDQIAYTSFENGTSEGNWTIVGSYITSSASKTGKKYCSISSTTALSKSVAVGKYRLEYWAKAALSITGGTVTNVYTSTADANGWILYVKEVNVTTAGTLRFGGTTSIDEVRLYPVTAQMTTYTYDPLVGMTSQTDENNVTTYYIYDSFGRLTDIKDSDGNVLKHYDYHYKQ